MRLTRPHEYTVFAQNGGYAVQNDKGLSAFAAPDTTRCPKVYVFAAGDQPVYVGQTTQGMAARMRLGFHADGSGGYYGYRWRRNLSSVRLLVWCLEGVTEEDEVPALECIEAEIVFAYRTACGQWPKYQTEIHFHETSGEHRGLAAHVLKCVEAPRKPGNAPG